MEECCCLGFLSARNALNSGSVLAATKDWRNNRMAQEFNISGILKLDFNLDRGLMSIYSAHGVQVILSFLKCQNVSLTFYTQTHLAIQILVSLSPSLKLEPLFPQEHLHSHTSVKKLWCLRELTIFLQ